MPNENTAEDVIQYFVESGVGYETAEMIARLVASIEMRRLKDALQEMWNVLPQNNCLN